MRITSLHIRSRDHDDDRITTRETAGGAHGGSWCEKESHEEAGEESVNVGWTCGKNGRGTVDEESGR